LSYAGPSIDGGADDEGGRLEDDDAGEDDDALPPGALALGDPGCSPAVAAGLPPGIVDERGSLAVGVFGAAGELCCGVALVPEPHAPITTVMAAPARNRPSPPTLPTKISL
jgi:hypothetical protein